MALKCKNCGRDMAEQGKISFGDANYNHYKCSKCNVSEYRAIGVGKSII